MNTQSDKPKASGTVELATFYVGEALCGMDILKVQEINKLMEMTKVPQAPSYVMGILNLRGQIVTIIDLGKKLGVDGCGCHRIVPQYHRQFGQRICRPAGLAHR